MKIATRKIIKSSLGRAAGVAGLYARDFRSKMVIVAFHRVNDQIREDGITCGSQKFMEFCQFFRRYFRVVPLSEQIAACSQGREMGGTLSITFDDGYRDNWEVAAPILRRLHLPATFFITTGFIGSDFVPPWDREVQPRPGWMDWDQVRDLQSQGFDIGAHTDTHIDMGTADADTISRELAFCRDKLRQELGSATALFAYPFGGREHITPKSRELIREAGFICCLSCCGGVNPPRADPFRLNRIGVARWFGSSHQFGFELISGSV